MSEPNETAIVKLEPLIVQINTLEPKLSAARDKAVAAMQNVTVIESDEDLETVNTLLVGVRTTYEKMYAARKGITDQTDKLKEYLMQFEKALDQSGKDNEVARLRGLISKYNQAKIDAKKRAEEEARIKKERENYKVDLMSLMRQNLSKLMIDRVEQVNKGAKDFFDACTLETFDARANQFKSFSPKLKAEQYTACFEVPFDKLKMTADEFDVLFKEMQAQEPYDKWNTLIMDKLTPILSDWKGKIPNLKQALVDLAAASSDAEKKRIEEEQALRKAQEEKQRQQELEQMKRQQEEEIKQRAEIEKIGNDFQEQAVLQSQEDTGPVKLIAKFKDDKPVKPLANLMYQAFTNPKFPGIYKKDKSGAIQHDEHGFPVYNDYAAPWLNFVLKYGNPEIEGVETKQVSKVIVRK